MLGIIAAMQEEVNAVLKELNNTVEYNFYGIDFWKGEINSIECVLAQSGIGKVNAARCTQILIDKFNPACIVNVGSAGALEPNLEIGDVVISSACVQHDFDITAFGHKKGYISNIGDCFVKSDDKLIELCKKTMESISENYKVELGIIATGDQFMNSEDKKHVIWEDFGAHCLEMEGAAVAQVCFLCNVPFVIIRSISDKAHKESAVDFYKFLEFASQRCAHFVEALSKNISFEDLKKEENYHY